MKTCDQCKSEEGVAAVSVTVLHPQAQGTAHRDLCPDCLSTILETLDLKVTPRSGKSLTK